MGLDIRYTPALPFQVVFRDKDTDLPLRNGFVTSYKDQAREVKKPLYKLSGSPPNYSYVELPNPVQLTDIGTFSDGMGNDIVPYAYPYDENGDTELYYLVVTSEDNVLQFTREGVPNVGAVEPVTESNVQNFIPNGQFLAHTDIPEDTEQNLQAGEIRAPVTYVAQGGWSFDRPSGSTAIDIVTFEEIDSFVTNPTGNPRWAINVTTESPGDGDDYKDLRIKFSSVNKFASAAQYFTYSLTAKNNDEGSVSLEVVLIKNFGSGGDPQTETILDTIVLTSEYQIFNVPFIFGENAGKNIAGGDDYVSIALRFPLEGGFSVSSTDFMLIFGDEAPDAFPAETDADMRTRAIAGWMPTPNPDGSDLYLPLRLTMQGLQFDASEVGKIYSTVYTTPGDAELVCDGTQLRVDDYSSIGIPYRRLFNKLWDSTYNIPHFGTGANYITATPYALSGQLLTTTNSPGAAAFPSDNNTGFTIVTVSDGLDLAAQGWWPSSDSVYVQNTEAGAVPDFPDAGTSGFTITVTEEDNYAPVKQRFIIQTIAATTLAGKYFTFDTVVGVSIEKYYMWFTVDTTGSDPAVADHTGILVNLLSTDTAINVAQKIYMAMNGWQIVQIICLGASSIPASAYFFINSPTDDFYVWYKVGGTGTDPALPDKIGIEVDVGATDTAAQVATATQIAINSKYFAIPDFRGATFRGYDPTELYDVGPRLTRVPMGTPIYVGSYQWDDVRDHSHFSPDEGHFAIFDGQEIVTGESDFRINDSGSGLTKPFGGHETNTANYAVQYVIKY